MKLILCSSRSHFTYHWLITDFNNPVALGIMPMSLVLQPALTGIVAVVCQSFFSYRVYIISGRNFLIPLAIMALSVLSAG